MVFLFKVIIMVPDFFTYHYGFAVLTYQYGFVVLTHHYGFVVLTYLMV